MSSVSRVPKGLILPASGGGQAYAQLTSDAAAFGTTLADIAGLTISPVPDSAQALVHLCLPRLDKDSTAITAATSWVAGWITSSDGATVHGTSLTSVIVSGFVAINVWALITGLTPGTSFTVKARGSTGAGNATPKATLTLRPFIVAYRA